MDAYEYYQSLTTEIDRIYRAHPKSNDQREAYPWLTGALGDPFAGIWFLDEQPSLLRMEHASKRDELSPKTQWSESEGDLLFRRMLVKHGFKDGTVDSPGGWKCYITNVIKEPDYVKHWHARTPEERNYVLVIWSSVLRWELRTSKPKLVVLLGKKIEEHTKYLRLNGLIQLPESITIHHYSYIDSYPEGSLPPMHPDRIQRWGEGFGKLAKRFEEIKIR